MRHRHAGKRSYDPQSDEKEEVAKILDYQYSCYLSEAMDSDDKEIVLKASKLTLADAFDVKMTFHMPIPKSCSKTKRKAIAADMTNDVFHTCKPDVDNLCKFYCDAANGILWTDDSQIVHLEALKIYSFEPRTEIEFFEAKYRSPQYGTGKINC